MAIAALFFVGHSEALPAYTYCGKDCVSLSASKVCFSFLKEFPYREE